MKYNDKVKSADELLTQNMLVKHYAGSIAYGTNIVTSDVDFRGIFGADRINIRTPFYNIGEAKVTSEEDTTLYELTNFLKLYLQMNPNIVETLWVDESDIVFQNDVYKYLRSFRKELMSSKIAFTTSGYALAQLKRIKGHNKWINNPQPEKPPRQIDYVSLVQSFVRDKYFKINLEDFHKGYRLVPFGSNIMGLYQMSGYETYDELFTLNSLFEGDHDDLDTPMFIVKFNKSEYNVDKERWKNYWDWKIPKQNKAKLFYKLEKEINKRKL